MKKYEVSTDGNFIWKISKYRAAMQIVNNDDKTRKKIQVQTM